MNTDTITVKITRRWFCFSWTTYKQVPTPERLYVYLLDNSNKREVHIRATSSLQALAALRDLHGYRTLSNAQLIDIR